MNELYNIFIVPFVEYEFMLYALLTVLFLSFSAPPIGLFLVMKRMSLLGDALSHAILPGAAIGYLLGGLNYLLMSLGGFFAGILMALFASIATRFSKNLKEDANFAAFYLMFLAIGVILVSKYGNNVDLLNLLFGSILSVDKLSLGLILTVTSISLLLLAVIYRTLVLDSSDSTFLKVVSGRGVLVHIVFQSLVVINLVSGFQALGTLMAVGLMMIPPIIARLWFSRMTSIIFSAIVIAFVCSYLGLVFSYHYDIPSGPSIILICAMFYIISLLIGREEGVLIKYLLKLITKK